MDGRDLPVALGLMDSSTPFFIIAASVAPFSVVVTPFVGAVPSSRERRDCSSISRSLGKLLRSGSRAELSEKWKRAQITVKMIIKIKGPVAVLMAKRPIVQTRLR